MFPIVKIFTWLVLSIYYCIFLIANKYCVTLKSKTFHICRFSPPSSFSPRLLRNIGAFWAKKYFTDDHNPNTIHGFRNSFPVHKMQRRNNIPFQFKRCKRSLWVHENKPFQKPFKRILHHMHLFKLHCTYQLCHWWQIT